MSYFEDGPKRRGRFIKKSAALFDKLKIEPYSFDSISEHALAYMDNSNNNIIHARLHGDNDEIVRTSGPWEASVLNPSQMKPTIPPSDFTQDWLLQKKTDSRKKQDLDEEFDSDENFSLDDFLSDEADSKSNESAQADTGSSTEQPTQETPDAPSGEEEPPILHIKQDNSNTIQDESTTPSQEETTQPEAQQNSPETQLEAGTDANISPEATSNETADAEPIAENTATETANAQAAEPQASEPPIPAEASADQVAEELQPLVTQLQTTLEELNHLKQKTLKESEGSFITIIESMVETLLGKEINKDPQVLANLIQKAIRENVPTDPYKIKLNPATLEKFSSLDLGELKDKLVASEELDPLSFEIEASQGTVQSNLRELVKNLVEQTDISLFDENE